jgi:hypothetical protein
LTKPCRTATETSVFRHWRYADVIEAAAIAADALGFRRAQRFGRGAIGMSEPKP